MTAAAETQPLPKRKVGLLTRAWAFVRRHTLTLFGLLALAYLMLPIIVVIVFSFNDPAGRFNYTWEGFTADHWRHPFGPPFIGDSVKTSLEVALSRRRRGTWRRCPRAGIAGARQARARWFPCPHRTDRRWQ